MSLTLTSPSASQAVVPRRNTPPSAAPNSSSSPIVAQQTTTPQKQIASSAAPTSRTPQKLGHGGWIHPRMDEVIRRRNRTNFDSSNMTAVLTSVAGMILTLFFSDVLHSVLPTQWLHAIQPYPAYFVWTVRVLLTTSIALSTAPLFRTPDTCEDIPLTPAQRQLLGLPPMSRPATPQEKEQYVTPPRFSRSNTPRSSASSLRAEASGSPLSGRGTPLDGSLFRISSSASPFASPQQRDSQSPLGYSPFRNGSDRRRSSHTGNRSSPLSLSEFESIGSTATPTKSNKASVGLNNKWLYEKGKGSPKGFHASRGPSFL